MNSFYDRDELMNLGFNQVGKNVLISRKCSIYDAEMMEIGNDVRIDDFVILSGKIVLHDFIHIAAYTALFGGSIGIEVKSFSTISSRCSVYAISDDYSGKTMTNPMIPEDLKNVEEKKVKLGKNVIVGTGTTILPGVEIGDGVAVGAMSLIIDNLPEWGVYVGIPCRYLKERSKDLLVLEKRLEKN